MEKCSELFYTQKKNKLIILNPRYRLLSHHSLTFTKSPLRNSATVSLTPMDGTTAIKVKSSAKPISLFSRMEKSSEVYRKNNNGPRTLPCGTPDTTLTSLLLQPSIIKSCDQFDRNWLNIDNTEPLTPTEQSLYRIPWWLTISKAALISICTIIASCPLSNSLCSECDTQKSASQVPSPFR